MPSHFNPAKNIMQSLTRLAIFYMKIICLHLEIYLFYFPLEAFENIITTQLTKTRKSKQIFHLYKTILK